MSPPTAPSSSTHRVQVAADRQPPTESDAGRLPNQRRTGSVGGRVRLRRPASTVAYQTQRGHERAARSTPLHRQRRCVTRGGAPGHHPERGARPRSRLSPLVHPHVPCGRMAAQLHGTTSTPPLHALRTLDVPPPTENKTATMIHHGGGKTKQNATKEGGRRRWGGGERTRAGQWWPTQGRACVRHPRWWRRPRRPRVPATRRQRGDPMPARPRGGSAWKSGGRVGQGVRQERRGWKRENRAWRARLAGAGREGGPPPERAAGERVLPPPPRAPPVAAVAGGVCGGLAPDSGSPGFLRRRQNSQQRIQRRS